MAINSLNYINSFVRTFEDNKLLKEVRRTQISYDDPKYFLYDTTLIPSSLRSQGRHIQSVEGHGFSFFSSKDALVKSLAEAAERLCNYTFYDRYAIKRRYSEIQQEAINPKFFFKDKNIGNKKLGWTQVKDVEGANYWMPAQIVYLSYPFERDEVKSHIPILSTGAAAGFSHEMTLLNGIYEVVERDAFMNMYLGMIESPKIDLDTIKSKKLIDLQSEINRYNLDLNVFDIKNDLNIPTYLSILVDKTGYGPAVCVGAKAGLRGEQALIGAIAESFMARYWLRPIFADQMNNKKMMKCNAIIERAMQWFPLSKTQDIPFLLNQPFSNKLIPRFVGNEFQELSQVIQTLKNHGRDIYYADITLSFLREINFMVYKVIIADLQPLYLIEKSINDINKERLRQVLLFFNKKRKHLNKVPHPFL